MYKDTTRFLVASFSQQDEEEASIIGPDRNGSYLSVSAAVAAALGLFAERYTFSEVCEFFGSTPADVEAFGKVLDDLEQRGLISQAGLEDSAGTVSASAINPRSGIAEASQSSLLSMAARLIFCRGALLAYLTLMLLGLLAALSDHRIVPGLSSMVFPNHRSGWILFVLMVNLCAVFLHEIAHFLAARSAGISAKFGVGHRLWIVVAETDLSGIWTVPRSRRYVPLLAGCIFDASCASLLLCVLYLNSHSSGFFATEGIRVISAITFTYFTRLVWQCFFFLRTDLYYVLATAFHCTNLMAHTTLYLKTLWGRLMGNAHGEIANLDIPARELSVVRVYAWFWLLGQIVAIWAFFFISIPITFRYIEAGIAVLQSPASAGLSTVIDTLGSYVLVLFPWFAGVYMWTRQLTQRRLWLAQSS